MTATASPMMQQYRAAKEAHPGMVLLFRMGDFYEAFDDDAELCARLLGLTLTTRDKQVPMAGFPHHQLENYLQKLLRDGQRVAVCDQVEPTAPAEVSRIVTPAEDADEPAAAGAAAGAAARPCLRCGDRMQPKCPACKMCKPCCWCR
jgi:DNA mismatch repair protein MutS